MLRRRECLRPVGLEGLGGGGWGSAPPSVPASPPGTSLPAGVMPWDPLNHPCGGGGRWQPQAGAGPTPLAHTRLVTGGLSPPRCRVPRTGPCPPASHPDGFLVPPAPPALLEALRRGNWTRAEPSPRCRCSGPGAHRMLPDCPEGAGGLPPPQVTPSPQRGQHQRCLVQVQAMLWGGE